MLVLLVNRCLLTRYNYLSNDIASDTGNTRRIPCSWLLIALMSAPAFDYASAPQNDSRNVPCAFEKAPVPSLFEQSSCTQESLASVHQHFDLDDTAVQNAAQISCLSVTPCPENGTSTLQNQPECEGGEALSAHFFTIRSSAAETTSLIRRENA